MRRARNAALACLLFVVAFRASAECIGKVYLTIDTGSMSQAENIARILNEENVKATFFIANEPTVRDDYTLDPSWDGYWRQRALEGHAFGNHTWSHWSARRDEGDKVIALDAAGKTHALDQKAFCEQMTKVNDAFKRATGTNLPPIWRAPGGRTTPNSIRFAAACGYPMHVHWSDAGFLGDELPSEKFSNRVLLDRALKNIKAGDVLMMHLGIRSRKDPFAPMLEPLIQGLKARDLCFATLAPGNR
jgi:peptidoglycan/xylan/chitin deacetylase (PgdA/CDA1 family)